MELSEEEFYQNIGNKIKALREKANHKQEDFSKLLGLSRASIVNIEKGRQTPSIFLIWKLSKIFDLDIEYFLIDNYRKESSLNTTLPESHEKEISEIANNDEFRESPELVDKLRNFVIESLSSS